jgi:hypothetical protein
LSIRGGFFLANKFANIDPELNHIAALLFIIRKKEVCFLYKPTLNFNHNGKLVGILGIMLNKRSTPAIVKNDAYEVGSCFTIQNFGNVTKELCPCILLQIDMVKDTAWEMATEDIALCILPTLVPLPFGKIIKSAVFDNAFTKEL